MRSKLGTIVFAQGWLDGQFESLLNKASETANEDPTALLIATQIQEQWAIISNALDDLIKEKQEAERKLSIVQSAFL